MNIQLSNQIYGVLYTIIFLISSPIQASECISDNRDVRPPLHPDSERLIDALTGSIEDRNQRLHILHDAAIADDHPSSTHAMLAQRALLAVAGEYLRAGELEHSRELLRSVPVESPVAVEASLLLADSWRMEEEPNKARDWYLRAGQRFPHELLALQGMLSAARALEHNAPGAAAALYDRVQALAKKSADQLAGVPDGEQSPGLGWLVSTDNDLPPALHHQLARRVLARGEESITSLGRHKARNRTDLRCVLQQAEKVQTARQTLHQRQREMAGTLAALEQKIGNRKARIGELRDRVEPGNLGKEQVAIRKSLAATQNELKRLEGEALFLRQNMERLPVMLDRLTRRLNRLYNQYSQDNESLETTMDTLFSDALTSLHDDFMDVAGNSQEDKARLIQSLANKGGDDSGS